MHDEDDATFALVMGGLFLFGSLALGMAAAGVMLLLTLDVWRLPGPAVVAVAPTALTLTIMEPAATPMVTPVEYRALLPVVAVAPTETPTVTPAPTATSSATAPATLTVAPSPTLMPTWTATPAPTVTSAAVEEWVFPTAIYPTLTAAPTFTPLPAPTATPLPTATLTGWWVERSGFVFASACPCDQGDVLNCADFGGNEDAQACYLRCMELAGADVHGLDGDNDGAACEWSW